MFNDEYRCGPTGPMGESFTPCDQHCPNCTDCVSVMNMNTFRHEWRCPNNAAILNIAPDEFLHLTYQDLVRICPDFDVSPFILGLYEDYGTVVYRIVDREGHIRMLQTEFAVKRDQHGARIAMVSTTQLVAVMDESATPGPDPQVKRPFRRVRL